VRQSDGVRERNGVRLAFRLTVVQGDDPQAILEQRIAKSFVTDMAAIGIQVQMTTVTAQQMHASAESGGIIATRSFDAFESDGDQRSGVEEFNARYNSANIPTSQNPGGGNITGYQNASVDTALNQLNQTVDPRAQAQLLDTAQRAIYNDLPAIPVYDHFEVDASRSYVSGLSAGPISGLWWNTEHWWINKDAASP
jgi:peptide/nickel transport system substrate-binding protein